MIKAETGYEFRSGKIYTHAQGLSCAFRQWRATHSHCSKLHGYALQVELEFSAFDLDDRNWVVDFGGLKKVKQFLEDSFDHKTLVAKDDPQISMFKEMAIAGCLDLLVVDNVGCEAFAKGIFENIQIMLQRDFPHATLEHVTVREHAGNYARYGRVTADYNKIMQMIQNQQERNR